MLYRWAYAIFFLNRYKYDYFNLGTDYEYKVFSLHKLINHGKCIQDNFNRSFLSPSMIFSLDLAFLCIVVILAFDHVFLWKIIEYLFSVTKGDLIPVLYFSIVA